jgi:hypothetical protein
MSIDSLFSGMIGHHVNHKPKTFGAPRVNVFSPDCPPNTTIWNTPENFVLTDAIES